jgi:hypothetical protein
MKRSTEMSRVRTCSSMDVLKSKAMLKALKWILIKYGKIEDVHAQEINNIFIHS